MKRLSDIIYKTGILETTGDTGREVTAITADSRRAGPGVLFVAVKGINTDGHLYIDDAIGAGATAILCERMPPETDENITYIRAGNTAKALGIAAANFYEHPSAKLKLIGVTGTNGKTTIVSLMHEVFMSLGHPCGMISTVGNRIGEREIDTLYTTPDAVSLNSLLNDMVVAGCEFVFMEVSSHAMAQSRTEGLVFSGGVFTNISHEHLDYHKTLREYLKAKKSFFDKLPPDAFALSNLDDKNCMVMLQNTRAVKKTYSLRAMADYKARVIDNSFTGLQLRIDNQEVWCRLIGRFNAYNILAVYASGRLMGKNKQELLAALSQCGPARGRFEHFAGKGGITGIIDFAHTPDALENVLKTIREIHSGRGSLITVIGCGGDRDKAKRPVMASIATTWSDKVIFTSDNPRFEDPEAIITDMEAGLEHKPELKSKYLTIVNRKEAIQVASVMAAGGDIILVAGKGHEKTQEVRGVKHPFDDKQLLMEILNR